MGTAPKTRIEWVDWGKALCMWLVIFGHISNKDTVYIGKMLLYFHMPLFFFISGYLFKNNIELKEFIKKTTKGLLLPYITINLLVFIFTIPYYLLNDLNIVQQTKYIIKEIIAAESQHVGGATWFIICLFLTEFIAYFTLKLKTRISIAMLVIFAILATAPYIPKEYYLRIDVAFMAVPFFVGGFYCKKYCLFDRIKKNYLLDFVLVAMCLIIPLFNGKPNMYFRDMGNYPALYYPIVFVYIFTVQRLLSYIKVLPNMVKKISSGTIIYIGLQGVGILYWNYLLTKTGCLAFFPIDGYINSILGSIIITVAIYPFMITILSICPQLFGRKKIQNV